MFHRNPLAFAATGAVLALNASASAQSLVGDTFTWQFQGSLGTTAPLQATVGPGPEFTIFFIDRRYEVDVQASAITIQLLSNTGAPVSDTWGANAFGILGQLRLTGLEYDNGFTIQGAGVSGSASNLDQADAAVTADSVTIGGIQLNNLINWSTGQTVHVDLVAGSPLPNDACIFAFPLLPGSTTQFSTVASGQDAAACFGADTNDVWFFHTNMSSCPERVTFSTSGSEDLPQGINTTMRVFFGCGGPSTACSQDISDFDLGSEITITVQPGETVQARVAAEDGIQGNGQISLTATPLDADADGVCDAQDLCPGQDDTIDTDGDGVPDCLDTCPNTPNVTNADTGAIFATITDAIVAASKGDTLLLGPCVFNEGDFVMVDRDLTFRGAGQDLTIIDGSTIDSHVFDHVQADDALVEHLTIRNAVSNSSFGGSALAVSIGSSVTYKDVTFRSNTSSVNASTAVIQNASAVFERCSFFDNAPANLAADVLFDSRTGATGRFVNCVFDGGDPTAKGTFIQADSIDSAPANVDVVNCTFGSGPFYDAIFASLSGASVTVENSVFDPTMGAVLFANGGGVINTTRSVHPSFTGNNLAEVARFEDRGARDFRLLPGTPGIDAADTSAYLAAGGGPRDRAGVARFFDDPSTANFDPQNAALDAGAFERQAAANPGPDPCPADLALPFGVLDLGDIDAFIQSFQAGCP